jgi:hypothetical protein
MVSYQLKQEKSHLNAFNQVADNNFLSAAKKVVDRAMLSREVSGHGVVIIDDYGPHSRDRCACDEFINSRKIKPLMHHINYSCISGIKRMEAKWRR